VDGEVFEICEQTDRQTRFISGSDLAGGRRERSTLTAPRRSDTPATSYEGVEFLRYANRQTDRQTDVLFTADDCVTACSAVEPAALSSPEKRIGVNSSYIL